MGRKKIIDEFTDLPISRQQKYQLRNSEKHKEFKKRYEKTPKGKMKRQIYNKKWRDSHPVDESFLELQEVIDHDKSKKPFLDRFKK